MNSKGIIYSGLTKKGKKILIRYPKITDTESILNYFNTLSKEKTYIRFQGERLTLKEEEKYMRDILKKIKENRVVKLLAFISDKLVGVADIKMQEKIETHVGIFGITVAKEFRGEGIGKLLLKLAIEEAKKKIKDLEIVTLGCFANNQAACTMYKNFGFIEYGNLPEGVKHKREYVDHLYFYKKIR
ncbi:hypothetical protein A2774_05285 [Candidatus Roizmanbacteria bacterium RIFCSPHIGHO2_01_FULL_39_12c]|uniref:N-acetyltransferase domain-containing protein n=1 Tax=Candidatus Roizmanbacteria bacterium RIFCSPHIGHO2_01_FULL_39_12c TaxID=1802031 RepID=A0A1F7GBX2_9BACT|nr:MAG: hypothetical protein A2774_05285 [Candidatus Roizmanbacteria bacterium RIFCSPHIGHO2_01_FULL_39_12c]OGK47894.1 MAG: hypothetical protein A2963_03525 [Candidatus Roizmanbacteria bacterium RIFCSPLOWO2_01_FULL_40_13]